MNNTGLSVQKGTGLLQNIISVTFVPRFIIISKLTFPLKLRQIGVDDLLNECHMTPGYCHAFHFTRVDKPRLLEASRFSAAYLELSRERENDRDEDDNYNDKDHVVASAATSNRRSSSSNARASMKVKQLESLNWFGEVNICNLGTQVNNSIIYIYIYIYINI